MYLCGEMTLQEHKCSVTNCGIQLKKKKKRSAVCGGFLSLSGYKPLLGGNGKMCLSKRNITLIISCQFQTGLRILKTLFDFYVFFKSWLKKNLHCMCCVFRCLWRHNLKSIFNIFFFWDELTLLDRESPQVEFSSRLPPAEESLKKARKRYSMDFCFI